MRKVIVSGGNGFIGSALIRRLRNQGSEVHALVNESHQRLTSILESSCIHQLHDDPAAVENIVDRIQPDTIFHLAAVHAEPASEEGVVAMLDANVSLGVCLLFAAARCANKPVFIDTGTYWQFGKSSAYAPNTLYAATKQAFQDVLQYFRERKGVTALTLILYDTFGQDDTRPKLWPQFMQDSGTA